MTRTLFIAGVSLCALIGLGLAGCGGSDIPEGQAPPVPVTGKVLIDGKPFGPVSVVLSPTDPKMSNSGGSADKTGVVQFSTYSHGDGVPAGTYKATLMPIVGAEKAESVPKVAPLKVTISEEDSGTQIKLEFKASGGTSGPLLPRGIPK